MVSRFINARSSYWLTTPETVDSKDVRKKLKGIPGCGEMIIEGEIYGGKEFYFTSSLELDELAAEIASVFGLKYSGEKTGAKGRKIIVQMTLDGKPVREWRNLRDINKEYGYCISTISRAIHQGYVSYGFRWQHKSTS